MIVNWKPLNYITLIPPIEISEYSDNWFEKRLKSVNKKLNTNYTVDDLKSQR